MQVLLILAPAAGLTAPDSPNRASPTHTTLSPPAAASARTSTARLPAVTRLTLLERDGRTAAGHSCALHGLCALSCMLMVICDDL